jgi:hypothetical protein
MIMMKWNKDKIMEWYAKIRCFLGLHQYIPVRYVWVQHKQPIYFEDQNYSKQGEAIVSVLRCSCCDKRKEIKILK